MRLSLDIDTTYVQGLTRSLLTGITELIWNAVDADATTVDVELQRSALTGIESVVVRDNGHGITPAMAVSQFAKLGGSTKKTTPKSPAGRTLHGRHGQGRFRPFGSGGRVVWDSVAETPNGRQRTTITIAASDLRACDVSDPEPTDAPLGTSVTLEGLGQPVTGIEGESAHDRLVARFALPIESYGVSITFDGKKVNPALLQDVRREYTLDAVEDVPLTVTVIEWKRKIDRGLYLCNGGGAALEEIDVGIQARGFEFTAYVKWDGFATQAAELSTIEMQSGPARAVLDASREALRQHFRARLAERRQKIVADWQSEGVYPFKQPPQSRAERAARDTFDLVALQAEEIINAAPKPNKRLSLGLLREALEQDPGSLHRVLTNVLALPSDQVDSLAELLTRTPLASVIAASRAIADRLDFVAGLASLTTHPDWKKRVKERSELHKILAAETWVFGEEYALAASDKGLSEVLKHHLAYLGLTASDDDGEEGGDADEVLDVDGHRRIVDLLLSRSIETAEDQRRHLVVELKRPSVKVGPKELQQVKDYALAIATDPRFDLERTRWEFWVVSTDVKGTADEERRQYPDQFGLASTLRGGRVRVWVKTWGEILHDAEHRLKFVKKKLGYDPGEVEALAYLRREHDERLPPDPGTDSRG
ncbi:ATP-binding protein [Patulibacter americanus]|uniref:ATP-binding protein n=1 Tax=Patulibacter americanus TaxID=588672 RepID=UPI0003B4B9D3|nr:ATP-binding protein [Patulibacter americanus]